MTEKKLIDMDTYPRRAHFEYFRSMRSPYVGATVDVDVTALAARVKDDGLPFFLSFLYVAATAANAVPELRMRIDGDAIAEYDACPSSYTVGLDDGTYCYCRLDTEMPFEKFLPYAIAEQEKAREAGSLDDGSDPLPLFFISTLPWLKYNAIVQPTPEPPDSNPRITWGRYEESGGKLMMPVTLLCNHAIVDGAQIAEFYTMLDRCLDEFSR